MAKWIVGIPIKELVVTDYEMQIEADSEEEARQIVADACEEKKLYLLEPKPLDVVEYLEEIEYNTDQIEVVRDF